MSRKSIYLTFFVLFLVAICATGVSLYNELTPSKITKTILSYYKKKYPDLTLSVQELKRDFESNLIIKGNNLVISRSGTALITISKFQINADYFKFVKKHSISKISFDRIYVHETKNIFLEKELDKLFDSLGGMDPIEITWRSLNLKESVLIHDARVMTHLNELLEKELNLEASLGKIASYKIPLSLIKLKTSLSGWKRNKELRINASTITRFSENKKFKQQVTFNGVLKSSGDIRFNIKAVGDLAQGQLDLAITPKYMTVENVDFEITPKVLTPNISGVVKLIGDWNFQAQTQKVDSSLKFFGLKTMWRDRLLTLAGGVNKEIGLELQTLDYNSLVSIESKLGLTLRNLEFSAYITNQKRQKLKDKKSLLSQPIKLSRELMDISEKYKINFLGEVYYDGELFDEQINTSEIKLAYDRKNGKKISFNMALSTKGFVSAHYQSLVRPYCSVDFNNVPSQIFNNFIPISSKLFFKKGDLSGTIKCLDNERLHLAGDSREFEVSFIDFNNDLRKFVTPSQIYKDNLFSKVNLIFNKEKVESLNLVNKKYDLVFKNNILSVLGISMKYENDNENSYIFSQRL